jgi:outer membrane protein TolC
MKRQFNEQLQCVLVRAIVALVVPFILAGCGFWRTDKNISGENLRQKLDRIDTVQLADQSVSEPITVEQATEQITNEVNEPNESKSAFELSLEQVRAAALANNLDLKIELVNPSISQRSLNQEQAKFEPSAFGSGNYTKAEGASTTTRMYDVEAGVEAPLPTGGSIEASVPFSDTDSGGLADAAVSVSYIQSLLRGAGARINTHSIRIAEHQWNIISARTKLTAIYLLASADIAYWRLYAARKELDVRREQYKLAQNQLSHAKKKVAAGSAAKIEIVRAEAGLAERLEAVINAETAVQSRRRDLLRIMNQADLPFEADINIVTQTEPNPLGLDLDEKQLIEQALANRMEMIELEQSLTIDDLNIELARNSMLPDLTLGYTYTAYAQDGTPRQSFNDLSGDSFDTHSVGVSATIPLGNRAARASHQQARLVKIQGEASLDRQKQAIRQEVYEAVSELRRNWRRILAAEQGVTAAYRDYKVEQSQFQLGVRTSTDVLYSATRLADAELRKIYAFADYEIAQIYLARATGNLLGKGQIHVTPVDLSDNNS